MSAFEYRIHWEMSSVSGAEGETEWQPWDGEDAESASDIEDVLSSSGGISRGLEEAIEDSGFGWSVEVREVAT